MVVTTRPTTHACATPVRPVCVCVVADESRWMGARTPSGVCVCVGRVGSEAASVCVSGWEEAHKARHVCVWREACHVCV